ncbi:uncharacterized protein LOC128724726 [Anopheles nili]|uniref:uncharacterized protein LOC128724726 n=1 Tax=Anopheles nili TaxID=185578 RepID=UPI00237A2A36|nr:uncharacterized protein LOC128724726 [Anopheles nili]
MSEPKPFSVGKDNKEATTKALYPEGSAFSNLGDDGLPTGPSLKSASPVQNVICLSDDETKTLTTLEPAKKLSKEPAKKITSSVVPAKKPAKAFQAVKHSAPSARDQEDASKPQQVSPGQLPSKENLIQKMRSNLNKQIDVKSVTSSTTSTPLDVSGAIEIPQDLILSNDLPPTPLAPTEPKASELEDHDLIAILEGNVVAIRENASEIEVCVGAKEAKDVDEEMESFSISIIDPTEVQQAKIEREKEIARRQIESLPLIPKVRKPRTKPSAKPTADQANAQIPPRKMEFVTPPPAPKLINIEAGVTIKGQTTIRPIVKAVAVDPLEIKSEKESQQSNIKETVVKQFGDRLKPEGIRIKHTPIKPTVIPQRKNKLIDSLVSDWDDEPMLPQDKPQNVLSLSTAKPPSVVVQEAPKTTARQPFAVPPPAPEPKRIIKRKIIWDPSDASAPATGLAKSNRGQATNDSTTPTEKVVFKMRQKRADSVTVHMIRTEEFKPVAPVRKRAQTPEPVQLVERKQFQSTKSTEDAPADSRAKKRKKNEIERLLGDEGAINMLYDVECESNRKDLLKDTVVDGSDEDEKLIAKTKIITNAVINQGKSPNREVSSTQGLRVRAKRALTPQKQTAPKSSPEVVTKSTVSPSSAPTTQAAKKTLNGSGGNAAGQPLTGARKRKLATYASRDWDYVYNAQRNDDAMIIRRRSNSSYSSSASPRRLSFDQTNEQTAGSSSSLAKSTSSQDATKKDGDFLFAKPTDKGGNQETGVNKSLGTSSLEQIKVDTSLVATMRGKLTKVLKAIPLATSTPTPSTGTTAAKGTMVKRKSPKPAVEKPAEIAVVEPKRENACFDDAMQRKLDELKQMTCESYGEYVEIVLKSKGVASANGTKGALVDVFSYELMNELGSTLTLLQNHAATRVVMLRSAGAHFSRGLDVAHLIQPMDKRKAIAEDMSDCLRKFLMTLAAFPKPIVAIVHGNVLGMGVMILPLFDVVLAQVGSSFMAPYGYFGYLPEGLNAFTGGRMVKSKAVTDLLLLGRRITVGTALDYGLVTETVPPEKIRDRALLLVKNVSCQSVQAMHSIKQHLRRDMLANMEQVLPSEQKRQAQQWSTTECQLKFKLFVSKGGEL